MESNLHTLLQGDSTTAWAVRVHRLKLGLPIGEPVKGKLNQMSLSSSNL